MANSFLRALNDAQNGNFVKDERSHLPVHERFKAFRARYNLTQQAFAERYGLQLGHVIMYEQPGNKRTEAARIVINMIEQDPEGTREDLRDT